ncbi:MAG: hypothetical protein IT437_11260 [Phycisphaerales bacterium]|nr:hypothetical protein [Phycisphaerales bacterium]
MSVPGSRIDHRDPGVRRVAVLDLAPDPATHRALIERLLIERDERTAVLICRQLGAHADAAVMATLWGLYADSTTPVRIAHAAVLAHDTIAGRSRSGGRECRTMRA